MLNKSFFLILFVLVISQILFSFYYSSEIINQNNFINQNQEMLQSLKIQNQELEKELTNLVSLKQIEASASQRQYINFKKILNLQN